MNVDELDLLKGLDLDEALYFLEAEDYRESFYEFYKAAFHIVEPGVQYVDNWHVELLCNKLQEYAHAVGTNQPRKKHLIINVPVRSSKSLICSIIFPVWVWVIYPHLWINNYSYSDDLINDFAKRSKDILNSEWFIKRFPSVILSRNSTANNLYKNTAGGQRFSATVRGGATGFGANLSIIDDPMSPKMASSPVDCKMVQQWYSGTLSTRYKNIQTDLRIIVMQRLSENDLSGYLLDKSPEMYEVICIPAELTDDVKPEFLKEKYVDGLYWATYFNKEILDAFRIELGSKDYSGQFLQQPSPAEGEIFKEEWFTIITRAEFYKKFENKKIVWNYALDTAETDKKTNDATAIVVYTHLDNCLYILDVQNIRKEFVQLVSFIKSYTTSNYSNGSRLYIEQKSNGKSLTQQLKYETRLNVGEAKVDYKLSKEQRAIATTPFCESKRVFLIQGAYVDSFLQQLTSFPSSKHDDMVDAFVHCMNNKGTSSFSWSVA